MYSLNMQISFFSHLYIYQRIQGSFTFGPYFENIMNWYPLFSEQIINQMHK